MDPIGVISCPRQCGDSVFFELDCLTFEVGRESCITELSKG